MSVYRKAYRFRMRPTKTQEQAMMRIAGARRFIWNWGLARKREHYAATGKTLPFAALSHELTALRDEPDSAWLKEISREILAQSLRDLERAFAGFFARKAGYPRFKSRKRDTPRFRAYQFVRLRDSKTYVPKVGWVRIRQSREVLEKPKSATFKRDVSGHWFVTIAVEFEMPDVPLPAPNPAKVVGIDLGLIDFATFSDGTPSVAAPKFYRKAQRKLGRAQRAFSRRKPDSNRRSKARIRVAKAQRRIANQRNDFLHKLSTEIVRTHDAICIEDLSVKGLARTKLAKSFMDAACGEFRRQLTYKAEWNRKHLVVIDRFYPSTKRCGACGAINDALTLSDRHWVCACGAVHDRDVNAARNIRDEGLRRLAEGNSDSLNARGAHVRPAKSGSGC
jgi:putative transposase